MRKMRNVILLKMRIIKLMVVLVLGSFSSAQENPRIFVEQLIDNAYKNGEVIGISAGVMNVENDSWFYSQGYSDKSEKAIFKSNTICRIASVTKSITAVAIMQLIEDQKLTLETNVSSILPEFNTQEKSQITVKHLLEHSSGIPHYKNKKEINNKIDYHSLDQVLDLFNSRELIFKPGTNYEYSVYGYVTLGLIIERITNMSYEEYLTNNIFKPAGMVNSSVEKFGVQLDNKSKLYHKHSKRKTQEVKDQNLSDRIPAGGVQSTLEDLLNFGRAILNETLLSKQSIEQLFTDSGLVSRPNNPYGMGFRIYGNGENMGRVIGHNGQQLGSSTFLFLFPDRGIVTAVVSNTSVFEGTGNIGISLFEVGKSLN